MALSLRNYPNPFNPSTKLEYSLPAPVRVSLNVYDVRGHLIRTLVGEVQEAGAQAAVRDGRDMASGVYFARLHAGEVVRNHKLLLAR